jgi:hypothetical protein
MTKLKVALRNSVNNVGVMVWILAGSVTYVRKNWSHDCRYPSRTVMCNRVQGKGQLWKLKPEEGNARFHR